MKERYKGYEIEISSREHAGTWQATAKITPIIGGIQDMTALGPAVTSGFKTEAEAIAAALMWAEQRIDEIATGYN